MEGEKKRVLFLDRDGVIITEGHIDSYDKLRFIPHIFKALSSILEECPFELVLVSNQDGVGTPHFPMEKFLPVHERIIETLRGEDIVFDEEFIDFSFPEDGCPGRKPGTAMLSGYIGNPSYDLSASYFVGDRITDMELAKAIGANGIWLTGKQREELPSSLQESTVLVTSSWLEIAAFLTNGKVKGHRTSSVTRNTKETQISFSLDLDGSGKGRLVSGVGFFDHMLEQVTKHARFDVEGTIHGDLEVDEHHTVEDIALALGQAVREALGDKRGIERYGFDIMMMDDVVATCTIDFSGRPDLIYDIPFARTEIGSFPTEMVKHFFKSFSDAAQCNLYISVTEGNSHHQAEGAFKAFAHAMRKAVRRIPGSDDLPSTKGVL